MTLAKQLTFNRKPLSRALAAFALFAAAQGCDDGPTAAPVHGQVSYNGAPVTTGTVTFYPVSGGAPAVGNISADGTYKLARKIPGDDVLLGEYRVTIEAIEVESYQAPKSVKEELEAGPNGFQASMKRLVPVEYSSEESSGLTAKVNRGDNQIDFNLP